MQVVCSACASLARRLESLVFCSVSLGVACVSSGVAYVSPRAACVSLACRLRVACVLPCVTQSESAALGPQAMTFWPPKHYFGCESVSLACRLRVACVSPTCCVRFGQRRSRAALRRARFASCRLRVALCCLRIAPCRPALSHAASR